jgi:hypothetical protein
VRRRLIRSVLPLVFVAIPLLASGLIVAVLPPEAQSFYLNHIRSPCLDWVILGLGAVLFLLQTLLGWRALQWRGTNFDERPDHWLTHLAQAAEWFPLLGLLGTVAGILQTFAHIDGHTTQTEIVTRYAPAITATGSGLFMALINILPTWIVIIGRDLIRTLAGDPAAPPPAEPSAAKAAPARAPQPAHPAR